jgi:hypothetical protein
VAEVAAGVAQLLVVMRKIFYNLAFIILGQCLGGCIFSGQELARFGHLSEACHVEYPARTQEGQMRSWLAICRLESKHGTDDALYVVVTWEREYPPRIDWVLNGAHSPVVERRGNEIIILYTQGVNTTCITKYSMDSGVAEYKSSEAIAWNDGGVYRTGAGFNQYTNLLALRESMIK